MEVVERLLTGKSHVLILMAWRGLRELVVAGGRFSVQCGEKLFAEEEDASGFDWLGARGGEIGLGLDSAEEEEVVVELAQEAAFGLGGFSFTRRVVVDYQSHGDARGSSLLYRFSDCEESCRKLHPIHSAKSQEWIGYPATFPN